MSDFFLFLCNKKTRGVCIQEELSYERDKTCFYYRGKGCVWFEIKCLAYQLSVEEKIWLMIQWKSKKLQIISILVTSHLPLNTSLEHIEMLKGTFFKGKSFYIIYRKIFPYFLLWRLLTRLSKQIITILHSNLKFIHIQVITSVKFLLHLLYNAFLHSFIISQVRTQPETNIYNNNHFLVFSRYR